jgi:hypothetical protein
MAIHESALGEGAPQASSVTKSKVTLELGISNDGELDSRGRSCPSAIAPLYSTVSEPRQ